MSTLMGFVQTKTIARPLAIEDPTGAKRTVYELISKTDAERHKYFASYNQADDADFYEEFVLESESPRVKRN